jgi:predicted kinase
VIIGGSGVGKSTLARALSDKLGILAYDVDRVVDRDGRGVPTPPCVRAAFVDRLAAEERWILDCNHVGWETGS